MNNRDLKAKVKMEIADALIWARDNPLSAAMLILAGVGIISLLVLLLR